MTAARSSKDGKGQLTGRADSIAGSFPDRSPPRPARFAIRGRQGIDAILKTNRADGDLLDCQVIDKDGNEIGAVVVARPQQLQASYYDFTKNGGSTIDGVTFTQVDADTRTASDGSNPDETHKVTPNYVEDSTVLTIKRRWTALVDATNGDRAVIWEDVTPGRQWAVVP